MLFLTQKNKKSYLELAFFVESLLFKIYRFCLFHNIFIAIIFIVIGIAITDHKDSKALILPFYLFLSILFYHLYLHVPITVASIYSIA